MEIKTLKEIEKSHIRLALELCLWNMYVAAQKLGIARATLYRKLDVHGIKRPLDLRRYRRGRPRNTAQSASSGEGASSEQQHQPAGSSPSDRKPRP